MKDIVRDRVLRTIESVVVVDEEDGEGMNKG